eukprot:GGOE01036879.1.p1 GENE.GGOE01036879.1~~GGOE01036879.1.p1  ORF type:complete len:244 (-),score=18.41 GGOE01036879.1:232-963(-)
MKSRYFSGCSLCGQAGHALVACPKHIPGRLGCTICGSRDHRAGECPNRLCDRCWQFAHEGSECQVLRCSHCGVKGHALWTCRWKPSYVAEDLKDVICYVCGQPGHLACGDLQPEASLPPQCGQCGHLGHHAAKCPDTRQDAREDGDDAPSEGEGAARRTQHTGTSKPQRKRKPGRRKEAPCTGGKIATEGSDTGRSHKRRRIRLNKGKAIVGSRWGKARDRQDNGFVMQPFCGRRYAALTIPV